MQADRNPLPCPPEAQGCHYGRTCTEQRVFIEVGDLHTSYERNVLQFFAMDPFYFAKAVSGNSVKIYAWVPGLTYSMFYLFGPESLGGKGNIRIKAEEIVRQTGKPFDEVVKQVRYVLL